MGACSRTTPLRSAVVGCHAEVIGRLLRGGATPEPMEVWISLLLGNLRGARRIAAALGYSRAMWRSGCLLFAGFFVTCVASCLLCVGLLSGYPQLHSSLE